MGVISAILCNKKGVIYVIRCNIEEVNSIAFGLDIADRFGMTPIVR